MCQCLVSILSTCIEILISTKLTLSLQKKGIWISAFEPKLHKVNDASIISKGKKKLEKIRQLEKLV